MAKYAVNERTTTTRLDEVKATLEHRRAELMTDVQGRIREVRADGGVNRNGLDEAESAEVSVQDDVEFALIQMKAETLEKIQDALRRIEEGDYGNCFNCGGEIPEARLRALPFALRCKDCEQDREADVLGQRSLTQRSSSAVLLKT